MRLLVLLSCTGLARALVPACIAELGSEFCPSSQVMSYDDEPLYDQFRKENPAVFPSFMTQNTVLKDTLFPRLNKVRVEKDLREFTDPALFRNRYCNSTLGLLAQDWILSRIHNTTTQPEHIDLIPNKSPQRSIVLSIPGLSNNSVSVGAHMDSINIRDPLNGSYDAMFAPGADDNASGSVVLLEVLRAFLSHVATVGALENEVQFHWYAAEEVGLWGSSSVFSGMRDKSAPLKAMLNLDMVGYPGGGTDMIGVQQDHVDKNLTSFVTTLIQNYTTARTGDINCGYPCSDHATAHKFNYSSAMIGESAYVDPSTRNPFIHSAEDTIENTIDFDYMMEFARLALAFIVELGEHKFE